MSPVDFEVGRTYQLADAVAATLMRWGYAEPVLVLEPDRPPADQQRKPEA